MNLKAKFESGSSYSRCERLVPGAFKVRLIGSTCTAVPEEGVHGQDDEGRQRGEGHDVAAQVEFESKIEGGSSHFTFKR
jgi:hypothetical protein